MEAWSTLARTSILNHSKYLSVEDRTVRTPSGQVIEHWPWVILPSYINVVVVTTEGKFLFFRQTKYALAEASLAPVGGYMEAGETALTAAQRELMEETGHEAEKWVDLGTYTVDANRGAGVANLFLATGAKRVAEPNSDDLEEQELVLLAREEVQAALAEGKIKILAWAAVVALALQHV